MGTDCCSVWNKADHRRIGFRATCPKEELMKRALIAGAAMAAILAGSQVLAQSVSVTLEPDQRTRIKEYVVKERVSPVTVRERITVGSTLPADVELRTVPETWGPSVSRYRYVYSGNNVYFVDPADRRVIHMVD
jgi:hypothetical protein